MKSTRSAYGGKLRAGRIQPKIAHRFSLDGASRAHQLLDQGGLEGRLVVVGQVFSLLPTGIALHP